MCKNDGTLFKINQYAYNLNRYDKICPFDSKEW